jgi:hypothetical protein
MNICTSNSPPSQSPKTLCASIVDDSTNDNINKNGNTQGQRRVSKSNR